MQIFNWFTLFDKKIFDIIATIFKVELTVIPVVFPLIGVKLAEVVVHYNSLH